MECLCICYQVTAALLKHAPNLKVVGRAGVGIDNIDVKECTKAGVMVMNTPGGNTVSTAQLAVTLLCAAARRISEADASMKAVSTVSFYKPALQ
jgi:D-3-phosphoglycerate dehydrogenase / 2-oxoglutarate reductase